MVPARAQTVAGAPSAGRRRGSRRRCRAPIATTASRAKPGSPTSPGPGRSCAGRRPRAPGSARRPALASAHASHSETGCHDDDDAAGRLTTTCARPARQHDRDDDQPEPAGQAGRGDPEPPPRLAVGQDAHRLVGLERGQHERAAETGRHARLAGLVAGRARRARSRARPTRPARPSSRTGVVGGGPGRDAVGDVGRGPDRFARDDDEPGVERGVVDDDPVEAVADLERHALAAVLERRPSRRRGGAGGASGGRRAAGGRRPRTRPRHRSGRRPGRSAAGRRPARAPRRR